MKADKEMGFDDTQNSFLLDWNAQDTHDTVGQDRNASTGDVNTLRPIADFYSRQAQQK